MIVHVWGVNDHIDDQAEGGMGWERIDIRHVDIFLKTFLRFRFYSPTKHHLHQQNKFQLVALTETRLGACTCLYSITMTYYQPQPPRGAATPVFSYAYPQDSGSYGYSAASPTSPSYPSGNYYPPSSNQKRTTTAAYYPPSSSSAFPVPPPAPRRRSASFSAPIAAPTVTDPKKKEMLYRHIGLDTPKQSSSKPRRFSKTHNDVDYEYLYGPADDHLYVSGDDSTEDDYFWENNKEKLSQRFQRPGLRRSGTEKLSSGLNTRQLRSPEVVGLGLKMPSTSPRGRGREREVPLPSPRERSAVRTRERSAVRTREMSLPRAPRPPAPQRNSPPPPPPPTSNVSYGSSSSHEQRHGGGHRQHRVREERKEKSWMNINGNKISVDHKGVKINGQRYEAPGGRGVFNVGGIKVRVEGRDISLA
ncbi:hypothetical protein V8F33_010993 [Rhypophila sp. PSN 637]